MATQKKIDAVSSLTDKVSKAKAVVLTDYRGLTHKQLEELRKLLKGVEAELVVVKNRLLRRALSARGEAKALDEFLQEPTASLFAYGDEVAPIKELAKYFKRAGVGKTKAGLLGSDVLGGADIARLAILPTRGVLLGQLAGQLAAPIQGLHYALSWNINKLVWAMNAIKNTKS